MINIVIDVLLSQKERMPIKEKILFFVIVLVIAVPLIFLFVFLIDTNKVHWGIISAVTSLAIPVVLVLLERNRIKKAMKSYSDYNDRLDRFRDTLINLKFDSKGTPGNWYSKSKIQYLIGECDKLLTETDSPKSKSIDFLKFMIVPILSFVAGVIADKASIEVSLSFAVIALTLALSIWGINEVIKFLDDIILKSSSVNTLKDVSNKLKDLLERDFGSENE